MAQPYAPARWPAAASTVVLWALAAGSVVFWGLRLSSPSDALPPPAVTVAPVAPPDPIVLSRFFGGTPAAVAITAAPEASSRFVLLGVVADVDRQGAALIAVDGKPARPFRVGAQLSDDFVLQSVTTRAATLGASAGSAPAFTLQLPTRPLAIPGPARAP